MSDPVEPKLGPGALAYWRAGLRIDDALLAAGVADAWLQEQREALAKAAAQEGERAARLLEGDTCDVD